MRIAVGSDHRGINVKTKIVSLLQSWGHEVDDRGANSDESVDYPSYAKPVALEVSQGRADRGVLVCGTGIGMAIAANKVHGVRATTCSDEVTAEICRRHNDVNVLCLSGDLVGEVTLENMLRIWLETEFEGGRHARRVGQIAEIEDSC